MASIFKEFKGRYSGRRLVSLLLSLLLLSLLLLLLSSRWFMNELMRDDGCRYGRWCLLPCLWFVTWCRWRC